MCLMYNETHNIVLVKRKRHNILCFVCKCIIYEEITFKSNLTQKFNSYYQ
ncbi:ribonucleoside-diphosphate reductase [Staphylococcus aureus]|nr:ribonucleoside-diphosphate reductase [Staphylococcus aureus]UER51246.1 ribonucleoside-diphosphate reductase [Staphylococcus aureus subsp. aureus ST398]ARH71441.2 ribonucleoside-diphosphate reductase [Staphylococcus aureus]ARH74186.2 ribonucleoside-diphosphate reductase [Staphylococcus aureus]ARH77084.2 ribonucleoside-diphosphate reductase [Staphylococcus aureus]